MNSTMHGIDPNVTMHMYVCVCVLLLEQIDCLSTVRVHMQKDLRSIDARKVAIKCVAEALNRLVERNGSVPTLDPLKDMKVR